MRQLWSDRGTTGAVALSVENGDAPLMNWRGVGARDFPLRTKGWKLDGAEVDKMITKKLSCGDCPAPCKGIVAVKSRGLSDVRRPDYETIVGFGAAISERGPRAGDRVPRRLQSLRHGRGELVRDAGVGVRAGRARHRSPRPTSTASTCAGATARRRSRSPSRWARATAAASGCATASSAPPSTSAAAASSTRSTSRGQEPAYHDPRFTSLMGVTYISDPTPGRHTAGSASWNETFNMSSRCRPPSTPRTSSCSGRAPRARAGRRRTSRTRSRP